MEETIIILFIAFLIVSYMFWMKALFESVIEKKITKCPYSDCPQVKYKECFVHGKLLKELEKQLKEIRK